MNTTNKTNTAWQNPNHPPQYSNRMEQIKAINEKFGPVYIHDMKAVLK